jgi:NDP-sugar pyrophosphorylase family protein
MIYVAAAGRGTRIKPAMAERGLFDLPKHLLPTGEPNGNTLLRRNVARALRVGPAVTVLSNQQNHALIERSVAGLNVAVCDRGGSSSLGPFSFTNLLEPGETGYSVAGDVFIDELDWEGFVEAHRQSERPITFLVGQAAVQPTAAVFEVSDEGAITNFRRADAPQDQAYRNIGVYAFDMTPPVVEILHEHSVSGTTDLQDKTATALIAESFVGAHLHRGDFFNINTIADYDELLLYTAAQQYSELPTQA